MFVRRGIAALNRGDPTVILGLIARDAELVFPGENSWSTMFRPFPRGRTPHVTHRGIDECRAFAERFVAAGIRFEIEDILVNGGPWHTRVAVRAHNYVRSSEGFDAYANRVVAFMELRWGTLVRWEDYEDTERVRQWDVRQSVPLPRPVT